MASSGNYLSLKPHFFRSGSDGMSEASESATSSISNNEDLQKLLVILGLSSIDELHQERFRVDRKRLEGMLSDELEDSQTATAFFHTVMEETHTHIKWPTRLKVGARSKKDPHIKIAGRMEDVRIARDRIMQLLDTKSNRVTMKLDVSYTDHSHIIGKGGYTIKSVMEETGCHIHFPDSNRSSGMEKSNQVSIAGNMENVERARAKVRALTPLIFTFGLPITKASHSLPEPNAPYIMKIQEQYGVQVMFRTRSKLHSSFVVVKGVQWEVQKAMEATTLLINFMCGALANQTTVQTSLEISPMHHAVILDRNAVQIKAIKNETNTQIMFPDAEDPNTPMLKRSNVNITGNIYSVFAARQQLIGCLPLVIMFDVNEENFPLEGELVNRVMEQCNVFITVRRKLGTSFSNVCIKGIERHAGDIYEARRILCGGTESPIQIDIPENYHIPTSAKHAVHRLELESSIFIMSYQALEAVNTMEYFNSLAQHQQTMPMAPQQPQPMVAECRPTSGPYNLAPLTINQFGNLTSGPIYQAQTSPIAWHVVPPSPPAWPIMNPMLAQQMYMPSYQNMPQYPTESHNTSIQMQMNSSGNGQGASSGYQSSNITQSTVSPEPYNISGGGSERASVHSPSVSPISKNQSPQTKDAAALVNPMLELSVCGADRRAVGFEKKLKATQQFANYEHLKAQAEKAVRDPIGDGSRVPTSRWAGCFFSSTSPSALHIQEELAKEKEAANQQVESPNKVWDYQETQSPPNNLQSSPNQQQSSPNQQSSPPKATQEQLNKILKSKGLDKYIPLFEQQEVDMAAFECLTEGDLHQMGVTAFGARKKILLAIAEIHKKKQQATSPSCPTQQKECNNNSPYSKNKNW